MQLSRALSRGVSRFLAGTPFSQEEFDDGSLFVVDVHRHFSVLAV
jgi:hypothetical protein